MSEVGALRVREMAVRQWLGCVESSSALDLLSESSDDLSSRQLTPSLY